MYVAWLVSAAGCEELTNSGTVSRCAPTGALSGASYEIEKSKFAFGSKPVREDANGLTRWVGSHGVVAIYASGAALRILNGGVPEAELPAWSTDTDELTAHTVEYFETLGIDACQIKNHSVFAGGTCTSSADGGMESCSPLPSSGVLSRGLDGIEIPDSLASATFVQGDLTTQETLYWPEIPADVVRHALAFRERLQDRAKLADYKKLLPENAQGDGQVLIHHSHQFDATFRAVAVYEVMLTPPPDPGPFTYYEVRDFDEQGALVEGWEE